MGAGASMGAQELPETLDRTQLEAFAAKAGELWDEEKYASMADGEGHVSKAAVLALIQSGGLASFGGGGSGAEGAPIFCGEMTMECLPCSGAAATRAHDQERAPRAGGRVVRCDEEGYLGSRAGPWRGRRVAKMAARGSGA